MFRQIGSAAIYVHDQDRAKAFYTEKLGFTLVERPSAEPALPA